MSPIQQGHYTLKKVGSRASRMAPVFQHASHVFLMLTTVGKSLLERICFSMAFIEQCSLGGTCPVVIWLFQVAPERPGEFGKSCLCTFPSSSLGARASIDPTKLTNPQHLGQSISQNV